MRFTIAIIAGILINAVLSMGADWAFHRANIFPPPGEPFMNHGLVMTAFLYRAVFSIFAAYMTAIIAKERSGKAVLVLGIIGAVIWLIGGIIMWDYTPAWYNIGGVVTAVPLAFIGGRLYSRRIMKKGI